MNYDLAIFLISEKVRGVTVSYEVDAQGKATSTSLCKTFDHSIKVGDFAVVPTDTRHKMTACRVEAVDVEPDFDSTGPFKWIIGVIDRANFEDIKAQEEEAVSRIKSAEKRRRREQLRKDLIQDAEGDLKALPIYSPHEDAPEDGDTQADA